MYQQSDPEVMQRHMQNLQTMQKIDKISRKLDQKNKDLYKLVASSFDSITSPRSLIKAPKYSVTASQQADGKNATATALKALQKSI